MFWAVYAGPLAGWVIAPGCIAVEGFTGRLAVECDGDDWHSTPEQMEADELRERVLRRSGLTFWRVRGGAFYRNPEKALESL